MSTSVVRKRIAEVARAWLTVMGRNLLYWHLGADSTLGSSVSAANSPEQKAARGSPPVLFVDVLQ